MQLDVFYNLDLWLVILIMLMILAAASYIGKLSGRFHRRLKDADEDSTNFAPTTILGLMALVLGFTFSMSVAHYENRRNLVIQEANAIGTAYLRADLLPQAAKEKVKILLKQYVDLRIEFNNFKADQKSIDELKMKTRMVQSDIWNTLMPLTEKFRDPIMALSVNAMNTVFDSESERTSATEHRIPELVYILLYLIGAIGVGSLGYLEGLRGNKSLFNIFALSVLFSLVIGLIMDIDRPRRGLIKTDQQAMIQLKESL